MWPYQLKKVTYVAIGLEQYALYHLPTIKDVNSTIIHKTRSSPKVLLSFCLEFQAFRCDIRYWPR